MNKLYLKISAVFALALGLLFGGLYLYLGKELSRQVLNSETEKIKSETAFFAEIFQKTDFKTRAEMQELALSAQKNFGARATIIDKTGKVLADSDVPFNEVGALENHLYRPEISEAFAGGNGFAVRYSATLGKDLIYCAQKSGDNFVIRFARPVRHEKILESKPKHIIAAGILTALFFGIFLAFALAYFVSRPLREIEEASRNFAEGDFSQRLPVSPQDETGALARAMNVMADKIEETFGGLERAKSQLEAIFSSISDGIIVADNAGNIIMANRAVHKIFGVEKINGRPLLEVFRDNACFDIFARALSAKENALSGETSVSFPAEKILHINSAPVVEGAAVKGVVLSFHDITELRRLEKIRKDFTANVSHELRTPVTNIKSYSEALLDGALDTPAQAREFAEIISDNAEFLSKLIADVLDLSRIEQGKQELEIIPCNAADIVNKSVRAFEKTAKDKGLKISSQIPDGFPPVEADAFALLRILNNLIDNAVKYTDKGEVIVSAGLKNDFAEISVKDTGIGIPEKHLVRIFERFYRIDKSRTDRHGTGLGLSICKHLVNAMGGHIRVESGAGEGSVFYFTLKTAAK